MTAAGIVATPTGNFLPIKPPTMAGVTYNNLPKANIKIG
jgi:hypothetical protein